MSSTPVPTQQTAVPSALPSVPWERVDQFLGQFTHDLRNGLNALELQLTLLGELNQDPTLGEDIVAMRSTLGNLSREMQAVRVAAGPVSPNPIPYPAGDLLEDLRERQEKRSAGGFSWQFAPELTEVTVEIDPELVLTALLQVLANALRFRESGDAGALPAPTLQAHSGGGMRAGSRPGLVVEIHEPKPQPLAPETLATWGAEPLHLTKRGGYGLGLFHARRIIEAHGGTLRASWSSGAAGDAAAGAGVLITTIWLPAVAAPDAFA